jgi:sulfoxide reductase heme-binding subunit YedZ
MKTVPDLRFLQRVVFVNSMVPFVMLGWDAVQGRLGANPLEFVTHTTGALTLIFLILSLAVTPVRKIIGWPWMVRFRRTLGLFAFFYGCLHLLCYVWFDKFFHFRAMVHDVAKRPFIALGMLSFVLLVPLAVTSTKGMVKRLGGKRWNRLHRVVYVAAAAGALHYYLLVKADVRKPVAFAVVLGLLLAYRVLARYLPARRGSTDMNSAQNRS